MSLDLHLDPDAWDLAPNAYGDLEMLDGATRIAQQVKITLLTFLGEWFLDTEFGVPYLESIMVKNPDRTEIESILRARVKAVPGVEAVPVIEIKIDAPLRQAQISLPNISTEAGLVSVVVLR